MIVILIILLLFSISLIPENIGFNFTFELRALVFAIGVTGMIGRIGIVEPPRSSEHPTLKRRGVILTSIDIAYIAVTILTVISFVTKAQNINAFHYAFVQVGMAVVYFFIRTTKSTKDTKKIRTDNCLVNFIKVQRTKNKVPILIVGIGFIVAMIGLVQFAMGKPVVSTFGRTSYLGCFLAMNIPLAFGLVLATSESKCLSKVKGRKVEGQKLFGWIIFTIIFGVMILTRSRTAIIATAVVLLLMTIATNTRILKKIIFIKKNLIIISAFAAVVLYFGGKAIYRIRPMSASGRVLIWKVSAEMFRKNPISGVGFGNFANQYNLYQAEYFASGKGSVINKMTAGQVRHAYNWYLETAVEFGIFGLIVFGIFWWLILVEVYKVFAPPRSPSTPPRQGGELTGHGLRVTDYGTMGMAGAVLCFMIMSLFQFPWQIIPTYLFFNVALAWIVNANEYTDLHISFLTTNKHE